jgi:hypothetical protein
MIDRNLADEAVRLLSTAIAELIEDIHPAAVTMNQMTHDDLASTMRSAGKDIARLAAAINVLHRRAGASKHFSEDG